MIDLPQTWQINKLATSSGLMCMWHGGCLWLECECEIMCMCVCFEIFFKWHFISTVVQWPLNNQTLKILRHFASFIWTQSAWSIASLIGIESSVILSKAIKPPQMQKLKVQSLSLKRQSQESLVGKIELGGIWLVRRSGRQGQQLEWIGGGQNSF